jgi:plastocyanin
VADAEQIYQEVLTEEQGKGVSPAVAEGRAKAARSRAEAGSPHPKDPKWWPGAQPHLEGGGDGPAPTAEAEAEEEAEAAPAEEPAAAEPQPPAAAAAAEAEPAQEAPTEEVAVEAAEQAPAPPAAPAAPAQPAEQPAAVAAAPQPEVRPPGVTHGTTAGTRVRPEDAVTTEAQFQGQAAMYERRKLIDELIATGVPATAAAEAGQRRSPMLAILYLLIPLLAIGIVLAQNDAGGGEDGGPPPPPDEGITITAANVAFDADAITLPADEEATVTLVNDDAAQHNFSIYTDDSATEDLFEGQIIDGGSQIDNEIPPLEPGEYFFRCDVHPGSMTGTVTVE